MSTNYDVSDQLKALDSAEFRKLQALIKSGKSLPEALAALTGAKGPTAAELKGFQDFLADQLEQYRKA